MHFNSILIMKKILFHFIISLCAITSIAQNIDLQEDTSVNNLYDSRQGSCAIADIDNDGDLDLIITGANAQLADRKTTLYSNDGMGNFTEITGTGLSNWSEGGDIAFADVDDDGDQDLLITGRDGSPNYYANFYLNDGSGNFTLNPNTPFEPSIGGDCIFEDVDNDGDMDLFMNGYTIDGNQNNTLFSKLYLNSGSGDFSEVASTPFETGTSAAFLDMDNDNDMDLIVSGPTNNNDRKTSLYENDGSGNFSLVNNTPFAGVEHCDISAGDSDGDGDVDILINGSSDSGENICHLYINDGSGAFSLLTGTSFITTQIGTADFADFDNDNDMDILVTGSVQGAEFAAHLYENQGMNNFNLVDSLKKVYNSTTALGDIDGDNDLDAIIVGIGWAPDFVRPRVYKNMLTTTSTEMLMVNNSINAFIYPNPSSGIINIDIENYEGASVIIYNSNGQIVFNMDNMAHSNRISIEEAPGLYTAVISHGSTTLTTKIMIN